MIEEKILNILSSKFEKYDKNVNPIDESLFDDYVNKFLTFLRYELSLTLIDINYYFNIFFKNYDLKKSLSDYFNHISKMKKFLSDEDRMNDVLYRWEYLYRTTMLANNHKLAMVALENIGKIYGVYQLNNDVTEKEFKFDINIIDKKEE